ncbi:hypothetical protein BV22DRAFT_1083297 [Leucogyrophana mollusca]|uniref:Uncharacterized protein n=1 Tax=Leucogyrophana mollusca TaxID=85980 RepID=A0ACB8BQM6_9AGAM|nr:hypothetical protein BV22DRAFT_1083297 [Leucogyrophana mollusca]
MMHLVASFLIVASAVVHAAVPHPGQRPLGVTNAASTESSYPEVLEGIGARWRLDEPPATNATGHLVFDTINSLLQHWPNTRYRNGHTIVPGTLPVGTLLYHGTREGKIPDMPDWAATDPEHSLIFCHGSTKDGCWHLTLATTRPLKVLYFDGSSAAKLEDGPLDSQDIVAWGELRPDKAYDEIGRIKDLCAWGEQYDLDGFVRMEMDFEVMLCNFTSGVEVVSFLNIATLKIPNLSLDHIPNDKHLRKLPMVTRLMCTYADNDHFFPVFRAFEVMASGSWHNHQPGDTRIQLDLTNLISFYDTDLFPSLAEGRTGQERWDHRLNGLSSADTAALRGRLGQVLVDREQKSSGVDWQTLFRVVADRYADRLEFMHHLLTDEGGDLLRQAKNIQLQLRVVVTPYALHSAVPPNASMMHDADNSWASSVFRECATTHTAQIAKLSAVMTASERLMLHSLQETTREICRVLVGMWADGVMAGLDEYLWQDPPSGGDDDDKLERIMAQWKGQLTSLMGWLDWSVWIKCKPACGLEEVCYLPTWPFGFPLPSLPLEHEDLSPKSRSQMLLLQRQTQPGAGDGNEWQRPQPKCIRRLPPYSF